MSKQFESIKISELIKLLQDFMEEHGDMQVFTLGGEQGPLEIDYISIWEAGKPDETGKYFTYPEMAVI